MQNHTVNTRAPRASSFVPTVLFTFAACGLAACSAGGGSDSQSFIVRATQWSVGGNTKIVTSGNLIAWVADEATTGAGGTDLNGDADKTDGVAVGVVANTQTQFNVGVAAQDLTWIGSNLFLVVSETADGEDWNGDLDTGDTVLLRWTVGATTPTFVDEIDMASSKKLVSFTTRLVYPTADAVTGANTSNLRTIDAATPTVITPVATTDAGGSLRPSILSQEEGLVFLALNESLETRVLNGDGDSTDSFVLALLDLRTAGASVQNVGKALPGTSAPVRAKLVAAADWQVGFLVSESAQGAANLDDPTTFSPTWQPTQCIGQADTDTNDNVLHYLRFAAWVSDPVSNPVRNTGLVGVDKIAIANGYIATITPESASNGTLGEGTCDLNQDGDKNDRVVRWTQMSTGTTAILPLNSAANIHALDDTPGGTHGLAELQDRFVIVVDEAQDDLDLNGDTLKTFDLVGWLLPSASTTPWQFLHTSAYVGASWMNETRDRGRLGLALQEAVGGVSLNPGTTANPGDNDLLDSIPTFPVFSGAGVLTFPGVKIAVDPGNPGIVVTRGLGYYRTSESADSRDWTGDGDENDRVLFRFTIARGTTNINGTSNSVTRNSIDVDVDTGSPACAAFLTDESLQGATGSDINGDGDKTDLVVQYFVF